MSEININRIQQTQRNEIVPQGIKLEKANEKELTPFDEIKYQNKNDGKVYHARKMTITDGNKEVKGVFVFAEDAKPDKNGQIQGEFMSVESFFKKMGDELPTINSQTIQSYNSNIKKMSFEEKFDKAFKNGVDLGNGAKLLRPIIENTGSTEIKALPNGEFEVKFTSFVGGYKHEPNIRTLSYDSLVHDRGLCGGEIKDNGDGTYEITYYKNHQKNNFETVTEVLPKDEAMKLIGKLALHF